MLQQKKPQIFLVQETKCNSTNRGRAIAKACLGSQSITVDASGASRGLAIIWDKQAIMLTNIHGNKHFIQATFHITGRNIHGHLTNVYFP